MSQVQASAADFFTSVGGVLTGLAEILAIVGAGIGYLIRSRRNRRRQRLRTETAATVAAQKAKEQLEQKLDLKHQEQLKQYQEQIDDIEEAHAKQIEDIRKANAEQVAGLMADRQALLDRLLDRGKDS